MIDLHTGGAWKGTALELSQHIRPIFIDFITHAMERDIRIAICTCTLSSSLFVLLASNIIIFSFSLSLTQTLLVLIILSTRSFSTDQTYIRGLAYCIPKLLSIYCSSWSRSQVSFSWFQF